MPQLSHEEDKTLLAKAARTTEINDDEDEQLLQQTEQLHQLQKQKELEGELDSIASKEVSGCNLILVGGVKWSHVGGGEGESDTY